MALDPSGTGQWYNSMPDQPPASPCVFSEVTACTGVPDNADGIDGDVRINLTNGDIYTKISGVWVLSGNAAGDGIGNLNGHGSPLGVVTPTVINQWYRDDDTDNYWWAKGLTSADWTPVV